MRSQDKQVLKIHEIFMLILGKTHATIQLLIENSQIFVTIIIKDLTITKQGFL